MDIDDQAVEIAKLSLTLRLLEGETSETAGLFTKGGRQRLLPKLETNIKCGNSLIGPDFYSDKPESLFADEDTRYRINAFDWKGESGFKRIFDAHGGFDVVLGNPPYIRIQALKEFNPVEVEYYKEKYKAAGKGNYDLYAVFVEQGLNLLNDHGRLGYILPHKFFNAQYGEPLRKLIADGSHLKNVVHFGDQQVFDNATTYTCLLFLDAQPHEGFHIAKVTDLAAWRRDRSATEGDLPATAATSAEWNFAVGDGAALFEKLSKMPVKLGDVADIFVGLQTSADDVYVLEVVGTSGHLLLVRSAVTGDQVSIEIKYTRPFIKRVTIEPFEQPLPRHILILPYDANGRPVPWKEIQESAPLTAEYLARCKPALMSREGGNIDPKRWYEYVYPKNLTKFRQQKMVTQVITERPRFAWDETNLYFTGGGNGPYYGVSPRGKESPLFLLALLNSPVTDYFMRQVSTTFHGGYWSYAKRFIEKVPIRTIDFANAGDKAMHDDMVRLVNQMLALHRQLAAAGTAREKSALQLQITALDRAIDSLVFRLYGLSDADVLTITR